MASFEDIIGQMLQSSSFQLELEHIQEWATNELYKAVVDTVYSEPEGSVYNRTYDLLSAILPTDLIVTSTSIEFKVIFDETAMNYTTLYGSEKYGLSPGDPIGGLIVPFLNEGWNYSDRKPNMSEKLTTREGSKFLEKAIEQIQADVIGKVRGALSVEVKKIGGQY